MVLLDNRVMERMEAMEWRPWQEAKKEVLQRARRLSPEDRKIVEMMVGAQLGARQVGQWMDLPPGTVSRKVARLMRRLCDPMVVMLLESRYPLKEEYRQLGIEHFLQGLSERILAEKHQMTRNEVRQILQYLRGWHRGISIRQSI